MTCPVVPHLFDVSASWHSIPRRPSALSHDSKTQKVKAIGCVWETAPSALSVMSATHVAGRDVIMFRASKADVGDVEDADAVVDMGMWTW